MTLTISMALPWFVHIIINNIFDQQFTSSRTSEQNNLLRKSVIQQYYTYNYIDNTL